MKKMLFVIPVYSMDKKVFNEKVNQFLERKSSEYEEKDKVKEINKEIYIDKGLLCWDYNHILAYIEVYKNNKDIDFKVFKTINRRRRAVEVYHKYMMEPFGQLSFYVDDKMTNKNISDELKGKLDSVINSLKQKCDIYVDCDLIDFQLRYTDFRKLFNENNN